MPWSAGGRVISLHRLPLGDEIHIGRLLPSMVHSAPPQVVTTIFAGLESKQQSGDLRVWISEEAL